MLSSIINLGQVGWLTYVLLGLVLFTIYQLAVAAKRHVAIRKLGGQRAHIICNNPVTGMTYMEPPPTSLL